MNNRSLNVCETTYISLDFVKKQIKNGYRRFYQPNGEVMSPAKREQFHIAAKQLGYNSTAIQKTAVITTSCSCCCERCCMCLPSTFIHYDTQKVGVKISRDSLKLSNNNVKKRFRRAEREFSNNRIEFLSSTFFRLLSKNLRRMVKWYVDSSIAVHYLPLSYQRRFFQLKLKKKKQFLKYNK